MRNEWIERTLKICRERDIPGAKALQSELLSFLDDRPVDKQIRFVAGIDSAYSRTHAFAAIVLYDMSLSKIAGEFTASEEIHFPYIPGYLSFREFPAIYLAYRKLDIEPDLLLFDGHGIAHPRRMGIASQCGILLDIPSIGCAKSKLCGEYEMPGMQKFDRTGLFFSGRQAGFVMRTRENTKPVFLSPGYRYAMEKIPSLIEELTGPFRLPLPVHYADRLSKKIKTGL